MNYRNENSDYETMTSLSTNNDILRKAFCEKFAKRQNSENKLPIKFPITQIIDEQYDNVSLERGSSGTDMFSLDATQALNGFMKEWTSEMDLAATDRIRKEPPFPILQYGSLPDHYSNPRTTSVAKKKAKMSFMTTFKQKRK